MIGLLFVAAFVLGIAVGWFFFRAPAYSKCLSCGCGVHGFHAGDCPELRETNAC